MTIGIRLDNNGIMRRPVRSDECVRRRAAELALPEVKMWLGADQHETDNELIRILMKHIDHHGGYDITKAMERDGWNCDSRLVDIMDEGHVYNAHRELVRQWVKCIGVHLKFAVGDKVSCGGLVGEVVSRDEDHAEYGIHTPDQKDGRKHIVVAEDARAAEVVLL